MHEQAFGAAWDAIGIANPELVLVRVAAARVHLFSDGEPARLHAVQQLSHLLA